MNRFILATALAASPPLVAADPVYEKELQTWRDTREKKLRADNGWLTLAGRFVLKEGANTFGTGKENDVIFPPELQGVGPERLGTIAVDSQKNEVKVQLASGVTLLAGEKEFTGERAFGTQKPDWVGLGRFRMHIIVRDGKFVLRLADNESAVRKNFPGCKWYPADEQFKVEATFVPYAAGKSIKVVNVLDQVAQEPCPGYAEFQLHGEKLRIDAIAEGDGLFFVFTDKTAGDTTYGSARFITVDAKPKENSTFTLDFNKAYNPPCAVSDFTTCPIAPKQNALPVRIEAGEKYLKR